MKLLISPDPRPDKERSADAAILVEALVDVLALRDFCSVAHWNVRGPSFIALHELFGEVYTTLHGYADRIAENIAMLGAQVPGTPRQVAEDSGLSDYPDGITDGLEHAAALAERFTSAVVSLSDCRRRADDEGYEDSYQLLTDVIMGLRQIGWKIASHVVVS